VATPGVDPAIRTGLVVAALVILLLWSVYKLATPVIGEREAVAGDATTQ
jgi:hypothetical protein